MTTETTPTSTGPGEECVYCPRTCHRCKYPIPGGFEHIERPQAPESNVVVCGLRRVSKPLGETISLYLDHAQLHTPAADSWRKGCTCGIRIGADIRVCPLHDPS